MASTSAAELLQRCLDGEPWTDDLLCAALAEEDGRAFFRVVVERLGDLFEPRLCDTYARLFARVLELTNPGLLASDLVARYERIRRPRVCDRDPQQVYVLSRVTLAPTLPSRASPWTQPNADSRMRRYSLSDREKIGSYSRRTSESSIIRSHTRGMVRLRSELRRALDYSSLIRS